MRPVNSQSVALSVDPLATLVGGRSTPSQVEPETVMRVTPDTVSVPDNEVASDQVELTSNTSELVSIPLPELIVDQVRSAGHATVPLPVTRVAITSIDRVTVLDTFPAASVFI